MIKVEFYVEDIKDAVRLRDGVLALDKSVWGTNLTDVIQPDDHVAEAIREKRAA